MGGLALMSMPVHQIPSSAANQQTDVFAKSFITNIGSIDNHRDGSMHIEKAFQVIACTRFFNMGLTFSEGRYIQHILIKRLFLHLINAPLFRWPKCVLTTISILSKLDFYGVTVICLWIIDKIFCLI